MLFMKLIGNTLEEIKKAKALYYRAFPKNERRSFPELVENRLGSTEVFCFYDEDTFVGIACLLNSPTISHIIYLAVDEAIKDGKITFFVAKCGCRAVGICSVAKCHSTFSCSDTGVYEDFYIEPAFRGKGIARKLAQAAQA